MTLEELRAAHRDRIIALANQRGAHNVRVFGSLARGAAGPDSDVDFEADRSLLDLTGLMIDLEPALGCKVDVISSRGLRPRFANEVLGGAVPL